APSRAMSAAARSEPPPSPRTARACGSPWPKAFHQQDSHSTVRNGERCASARAFHWDAAARISSNPGVTATPELRGRKLPSRPLRIAVYSDFPYRRENGVVYAEQAFALFLAGLAEHLERVTLVGRLDPAEGRFPYRVPEQLGFEPLPHYPTLAKPLDAVRVSLVAMRRFWSVLGHVDGVWLLGPHPLSLAFALLAKLRRRRVTLGVRQALVAYARNRHPGR